MKKEKKAQSALEYLMTYGWALVVIVVVVSSLVILINPGSVSGSTVNGFTKGIVLENSLTPKAASDPLQLVFYNQTGRNLHNLNYIITDSLGSIVEGTVLSDSGQEWNGESTDTFLTGAKTTTTFTPNSDWIDSSSFNITISYTDPDGFSRTSSGTMNTKLSSTATPINCGNGIIEGSEQCDTSSFGGENCSSLGAGTFGSLSCSPTCTIITSACHDCGNGIADLGEACDGSNFTLGNGCENYGFAEGERVTCSTICTINTSVCSLCGNDIIDDSEECDGPVGLVTCADLGYFSGDLGCYSNCQFDESNCIGTPAVCGDGIKEGMEICDPPEYGGETCESLGFASGDLHCYYDCSQIATWGCESCGNGTCEPEQGENFGNCADCSALCNNGTCELEIGENFENCPEDCDFLCGNEVCEPDYGETAENCVDDCGICVPDTCAELPQSNPCGLIVEPACGTTINCGECAYSQYECSEEHQCVCVPEVESNCISEFGSDGCGIGMDFTCMQNIICGCPGGFTCTVGIGRPRAPVPDCLAITDGCQDECEVAGIKHCFDDSTIQECGNFDGDMCLEWGNSMECGAGKNCVESVQNPFASCRIP